MRVAIGLLVLIVLSFLVSALAGDALETFGRWFIDRLGVVGVGAAVAILDTSPVPMISEPVYLLALSGGLHVVPIGIAGVAGSLVAVFTGYGIGLLLGEVTLKRFVPKKQLDLARDVVSRYGFWGIALAALTPIPYAPCAWTAGAIRMRLLPYIAGSLFRIPKVAFYLWLVYQAWQAGR